MTDFKTHLFFAFFLRYGVFFVFTFFSLEAMSAQNPVNTETTKSSAQYRWDFVAISRKPSNVVKFSESILEGGTAKGVEVNIIVNIKNAEITLGSHEGQNGALYLNRIDEGSYFLRVESEGYEDYYTTLTFKSGRAYTIEVDLVALEGYLSVSANVDIQELLLDNFNEPGRNLIRLKEGNYNLRIRSFGYEDFRSTIQIRKDQHLSIQANLVPTSFSAKDFGPTRPRFRPENPGDLGTSQIKFEVQAPGTGKISLYTTGESESLVLTESLSPFTTWNQAFLWAGNDQDGMRLPDGSYRYVLELSPAEGISGKPARFEGSVVIDSTSFLRYQSLVSGVSGTLLAAETYTLPQGAFQLGFALSYRPEGDQAVSLGYPAFHVGTRFSPYQNLEFGALLNARISQINQGTLDLGINFYSKYALVPPGPSPLSFALALSGGFIVVADETQNLGYLEYEGPRPGVFLHLPVHLALGSFGILLEPSFNVSPWPALAQTNAEAAKQNWGFESTASLVFELDLNEVQFFLGSKFRSSYISFDNSNSKNSFLFPDLPFTSFLEFRFTLGDGFGLDASISADSHPGKYAFANWLVRFEAGLLQ